MRLSALVNMNQEKLHQEYEDLLHQIEYLNSILNDPDVCRKVIEDELVETRDKYGDERRTEIVYASEEFNAEDFYADDDVIITISHLGYIKRTPLTEFRAQNRGGVGVKGDRHAKRTSSSIYIRLRCITICCSSRSRDVAIG